MVRRERVLVHGDERESFSPWSMVRRERVLIHGEEKESFNPW